MLQPIPKKKPLRERAARITVRLSDEEKAGIVKRADERNLPLGEYLIRTGLGRATRQRADVDAINLLRECSDQLKGIYHAVKVLPVDGKAIGIGSMDEQMKAITGAISRVWNNGTNKE
jgi:hypothetical protein